VPFTPSALFLERLPWDYPVTGSGLPRQMNAAQRLATKAYVCENMCDFLPFPQQRTT
jgi:hypothetical protein